MGRRSSKHMKWRRWFVYPHLSFTRILYDFPSTTRHSFDILSTLRAMDTRPTTNITSHQPDGNVESKLPQFGATWADTDSSHLLPTLPLKHIPRAWERKAQSPLVKQRFARKIWRRHEFPQSLSTTNMTNNDAKPLQHAHVARLKKGFLASHSPKKIVKKRCLLGQTASANQWDQKASTPLRTTFLLRFIPLLYSTRANFKKARNV